MLLLEAAPVYDCWFLYRSQLGSFGSNGRSTISSQHNNPHCIVTDRSVEKNVPRLFQVR